MKRLFPLIQLYIFAIVLIIIAAAICLWPLHRLDGRTGWIICTTALLIVVLSGELFPASLFSYAIFLFLLIVFIPKYDLPLSSKLISKDFEKEVDVECQKQIAITDRNMILPGQRKSNLFGINIL